MKLFATPNSPYARKVRVVLTEKHIDCEIVMVPSLAAADSPVPEFNPLGKVPTLVLDSGESLYDSAVITGYLDQKTPANHLIPQGNLKSSLVRCLEALADGICDAAVAVVMELRRPAERQDAATIERQKLKVGRGLRAMAQNLGEQRWCTGDNFTLADIAAGCALDYVALRLPELDWQTEYPGLARLHQQLQKRPSFRDSAPPQG